MKIRIKKGEIGDYYHIYINDEYMKCTSEGDAHRIIKALMKMFDKGTVEIKENWHLETCNKCKGYGKLPKDESL